MSDSRPRLLVALGFLLLACQRQGDPVGPGSNRAPEIRNVTVSPSSVAAPGTATVRVEAVDPDGDHLFYRYEAEVGSLTPEAGDPSRALYAVVDPGARSGDRLSISVTDTKNAAALYHASVSFQGNQPPRVELPNPGSCHPPCEVQVVAEASDPEGGVLTYQWSGCATGSSRAARCEVTRLGRTWATVAVQDGRGGVAVASAAATGTNVAPVVSGGQDFHSAHQRLLISVNDPDDNQVAPRCAWWGDCQCTGDFQSFNTNCDLPATVAACTMIASCWDQWGGIGETRFRLLR